MESTVLSGPLGHTQWETEQPFPLGFHTLGTDNRGVPFTNTTSQAGFQDFRNDDPDKTSQQSEDIVYMDKPADLDNLIDISDFPFGGLELVGDKSLSQPPLSTSCLVDLPLMETNEGANEMSDCTLSWSFSPEHPAVAGKTSANEDLSLTFKDPLINSDASCSEAALKRLNAPVSPFETPETVTENPFLLVDLLSEETSCVPSGEITPRGVSEELLTLSQGEEAGLPPSQTWETLSPETGDKGLYSSQVTELPGTCSSSLQGLPDNSLLLNHISTPLEFTEGAVPLLDLAILDCDSSLSPCLLSVGSSSDPSIEEPEVKHLEGDAVTCQTLEQGENESCAVTSSVEPSPLTSEDDVTLGAFTGEQHPEENEFKELIEDNICSEAKGQGNVAMALDLCLTTDEVCHAEIWDLKGQEGVQKESLPDLTTERREEESLQDANTLEESDCHEVASLDLSVQDLDSSAPGAGWTHKQAVTISLSKMVVDDSLPMVSAGSTREEDVSPLKAVFDALDQDGDGFVRIEEFMEYAAAYGADQVKDLTKFLDPSGLGVISFEDFHRGISAISNGGPEPQLYSATFSQGDNTGGCPEEYDEQNEVTDSAYLGSESTYSECETFTDEDTGALVPPEMHEDVETDSGIEATLHDPEDASNRTAKKRHSDKKWNVRFVIKRLEENNEAHQLLRFSLNTELHSHQPAMVTMIGGEEEHFEDFGESNTSELLLEGIVEVTEEQVDSPLVKTPEQVNGSSLLSPSAPAPIPDCFQSFLREEALDFFCSQCHKQISRLEDLSTRLNFLEMTSAGKRLSSKKVARHLLQNSSMTLDTMSDLTRDIMELANNDITDKVLLLERRVAELEKESESSVEQHARLRQENLQLVHRANALEEQLKEQELCADEQMQLESRRQKDAMVKMERERGLEVENLQARLQQLDEENSELRSCVPCLRANIERLEEEKRKLQDETEAMSDRLSDEIESRKKMADKLSHERHQNQKEKEATQELIEDLRKQLEHLQLYKLEAEAKRGRTPGAGLQEYQTRTREAELEQEIKRLKQDNRSLKDQNDELNGQIINLSIQGAKNLMSASFSDSLAAEINSVSRTELMEAVHKQEEINYRLQDYIDKIIVAIMECNPSILEVK